MAEGWFRTAERLPPEREAVYVAWDDDTLLIARYTGSGRWYEHFSDKEIDVPDWWTPWLRMPEQKEAP